MQRETAIALMLGIGAILLGYASGAGAVIDHREYGDMDNNQTPNTFPPPDYLSAFLATIRRFESDDNYYVLYGGGSFSDTSRHPAIYVPINLPGYEGKKSSAAGAYQINKPTFDQFGPPYGIDDFSPASQDAIAINILSYIGAMPAIERGDVESALRIASRRWASLPYSTANQNPVTLAAAIEYFHSVLS